MPAVTPTPASARFWDRIAARYAAKPVPDRAIYEEKLRITRDLLRPGDRVLEIGCGTGSTALAHAPHVAHVLATDISAAMIAIAKEKAAQAGAANVTFRRAALAEIEPSEGPFDAVLALSLLHLLEDRDAALARIHALLRPGGVFVSSTPCLGDRMAAMRLILPVGRALGLFPLVRVFKRRALEESLARAGFAIERAWQPSPGAAVFLVARRPG
jgi:2-polyprenyl-3-methyl-5-hydroxy-6-metoxy-1,4-benzoquinol methylase